MLPQFQPKGNLAATKFLILDGARSFLCRREKAGPERSAICSGRRIGLFRHSFTAIPSIQLIDSPMPTTTGVEFQQQFVGKVLLALKDVLRRGEFWGIDNSLEMLDKVPRKDDLVLKTCSAEILEDVPDKITYSVK